MVILLSLFYVFFSAASCDKKNGIDIHDGKETEVVEDSDGEGTGEENEEAGQGDENDEEQGGQQDEEDQQQEEDPNFNYGEEYQIGNGFHVPFVLGETPSPYGYFMFFPESYKYLKNTYPVLIFLHGSGERGNSQTNTAELNKAVKHGPGKLINKRVWSPKEEMLVVSAQTRVNKWGSQTLKHFIDYLLETYRIDESRVYLTGLSLGAFGTFDYLGKYGADSKIAAAVAVCGGGASNNGTYVRNLSKIPLWVFHGEADQQVPVARATEIVQALKAINPKQEPKLTLYPNVGHDSWTMTYDGSGQGKENPDYDAFDQDVYSWMLQYRLP
ncbi:prolyl oligopeptidase family serine peptidase [Parapedobacter sp. 10938]|uniref:carboxylesterase family protein n=1 Tax=Parapedobacter flavus TaxID=3110225 RepID=UPI002DB98BF3|nr:prolyl oligopeptidase family serine peptidase [Parapedobacter sp. 10938]MEC3879903.1 prolyl oligopeptidase family serine peptidase [Parapedobacter sp. 10938]